MPWLALALAAFRILNGVLEYARSHKTLNTKDAIDDGVKEALRGLQLAKDARSAVDADLHLRPDSLRDDDGFKRPEPRGGKS